MCPCLSTAAPMGQNFPILHGDVHEDILDISGYLKWYKKPVYAQLNSDHDIGLNELHILKMSN